MFAALRKAFLPLLVIFLSSSAHAEDPYLLYQLAEQACKAYNRSKAIEHLKRAFEGGYPTPSKVLANRNFRPLREGPEYRNRLRSLMKQHIRETEVTMVDPGEKGDRLVITGKLVDSTNAPVANATIFVYHTDNDGLYAPEHSRGGFGSNNPLLFVYVKTDVNGEFKITTIRPNGYPNTRNLRHVHFEITSPDCNQVSQFFLDRDPEPTPEQIAVAEERNWPILRTRIDARGTYLVDFLYECR